jgi:hypothetical protein
MKRSLIRTVVVGALALVATTPTYADHAYVFGGVTVFRSRSSPAVAEYVSKYTTCSGTSCAVTVSVGKRDYGRVEKWCGSTSKDVTVEVGSFGGYVECAGSSPWYLLVHVAMRHARDNLTTHAEPVTITVNVIP